MSNLWPKEMPRHTDPWQREFRVEVGQIDVLLLSSQGRVAIVETKLASNPELRRRVLAQVLDYLCGLKQIVPEAMEMSYPRVPADQSARIAPQVFKLIQQILDRVEQ